MADAVLVTGGSGFVAGHLIRLLIAEGWTVHTTVRSLAKEAATRAALKVDDSRLTFFAADLGGDDGWAEAARGCTHVAHVASPIPLAAPKHEDELIVPARDGALRVLQAARDAGVKRVVMTSSGAAIQYGHGQTDRVFTEADWTNVNGAHVSAYNKSKTIAERAARDWIAADGGDMEYVSICPTAIMGPAMSDDFAPSIEIVKRMLGGEMPGVPNLGFGIVDVRDLSWLHWKALTQPGLANERFLASSRFYTMIEIARILREQLGDQASKVPGRVLPDWLIRAVAIFKTEYRQFTSELGNIRKLDASHARQTLGWEPTPVERTLADTGQSLIDLGVVKA